MALAAITVALLGAAFVASGAAPAAAEDSTLTITAGEGENGYAINAFLPQNISVITGTTVRWELPWYEPHIIAGCIGAPPDEEPEAPIGGDFPNAEGCFFLPFTFGDPANPPTFEVRFVEAGTYDYFCPIHPQMVGQVKVFDEGSAGSQGVDNQQSADARAAAELNTRLINIKGIAAEIVARGTKVTTNPNGTKHYEVTVGGNSLYGDDVMQFIAASLNVKVGDSVTWKSNSPSPHNVLFGGPPKGDPFEYPGDPDGSKYDGSAAAQSAMMFNDGQSPNSFELVFTKEGSFQYICMLHAPQGMAGVINVGPSDRPQAPGAPNTGSGLDTQGSPWAGWALVLGALLTCGALGAGVAIGARRQR